MVSTTWGRALLELWVNGISVLSAFFWSCLTCIVINCSCVLIISRLFTTCEKNYRRSQKGLPVFMIVVQVCYEKYFQTLCSFTVLLFFKNAGGSKSFKHGVYVIILSYYIGVLIVMIVRSSYNTSYINYLISLCIFL